MNLNSFSYIRLDDLMTYSYEIQRRGHQQATQVLVQHLDFTVTSSTRGAKNNNNNNNNNIFNV